MSKFVKHILIILIVSTQATLGFSQCEIEAFGNNSTADTVRICMGDHINLRSNGDCDVYLMQNDFNSGSIGSGWSSNANPMFNNPCVAGPDGSICLWVGPATTFPRQLVTVPYSVTQSCTICFDMIYSVQGVPSPCEGPDLPTEGVHLQWSNNAGATWTDINYWGPNGGYDANMTNWRNYCCNVPVAGTNIQFRWFQSNTSGNDYDHWGIDNVVITCPSPPVTVWWTGPAGFTYNNFNPPSFAPTTSGWYVVNISDGNYSASDSVYVLISQPLFVSLDPTNPTLCYGQTTTTITSQVTGGTPPYIYSWSNGATTTSINVGQGVYSLIVSDIAGCFSSSASVLVTANSAPITVNAGSDQTLCITATTVNLTGNVTVATGGIWSGGNGVFSPSNTSLNATYYPSSTEIQNGVVTLTLTSTGNGSCPIVTDNVVITFHDFLGNLSITNTNVNCYGGDNGSATIQITGGSQPFTYAWNTSPLQTTQTATNLSLGSYVVTITDAIGCTTTSSAVISQPPSLTALVSPESVSCFGGNTGYATVTAFGGTPGYAYIWSNGSTSTTIVGLAAGNYDVTVTDALGCQYITSTQITSPVQLSVSISNPTLVACFGQNTGSATVNVLGGTPGYTYFWSSGAGTSPTAIGMAAGNYSVTVTDQNGCSASTQVSITEPTPLNISTTSANVTCYGGSNGSASANVTGGSPPYLYVWSPYGGATASANGLISGIYSVTITDSHACQMAAAVTITQPEPLLISATTQNVQCFNTSTGSASLSVSGGVSPYIYHWNPNISTLPIATGLTAGNYNVTVSDANNCSVSTNVFINQPLTPLSGSISVNNISCYGLQNGSMTANPSGGTPPYVFNWQPGGNSTQTVTNLVVGNYFVTITDANQCTVIQSASLSQPGGINLNAATSESSCNNATGMASVSPSGGTSPYTYNWMPGGITTSSINLIPSGIYYVTVSDAMGCSSAGVVTVNDFAGPQVSITDIHNATCFGVHNGWASATATGGLPPYNYAWYPYGGNNDTAWNLGAGTYTLIVSDANGCQGLTVTNPAITQPTAISISSSQVNVACTGASNGSANLTVTGGTPPYTYLWSPGGFTFANPIGLSQGTYQVTVSDFNHCEDYYFVDIIEPPTLTATISASQNISCYGLNNGSATVLPSGGTPPYSYLWSPSGSTSQTATGLTSGTHTVFVSDAKGCSFSVSVFLTQPAPLSMITGFDQPLCNSGADASAWVFASGGSPPYTYTWSPFGGSNDTAINLHAGIYSVLVTDFLSCQSIAMVNISQPPPLAASISNFSDVDCFDGSNGYAIATVSGGTPTYQYLWSNGVISPANTNLSNGDYYITITDANGCIDIDSVSIQEPAATLILNITHQDISCYGFNNGSAFAQVNGGTPPYTYIWVPSVQFTPQANNLAAGTYTVSVIDANGCQASSSVTLAQPQAMTTNAYMVGAVQCNATATGSATVTAMGGVLPYDFNWSTVPVQTTPDAQGIFAGFYYVTVTDANGCHTVDSVLISEPPSLQSVIVSQTTVSCFGGNNAIATGGAIGGTPPYLFAWSTQPIQTSQSIAGLYAGAYTLTVTDNNGCTTTTNLNISQPTQVITSVTPNIIICKGEVTVLSASASGGTSPYVYNWNQSLGFGYYHTVNPQSNTEYIATAFDANGCMGISDTISVHVLALYPQDVNLTAFSPICPGNSSEVSLTANCDIFDTLTYAWSHGLGPGTGPFVVVPTQPTYYVVTVTNTCGFSVADSALVNFAPPPTIQFSTSDIQGCVPLTIDFTDNSWTSFDDISSWQWNFGDGNTSSEQNVSHTFTTSGTYAVWLTLTTTQGCTSNSQGYPLEIFAFEKPTASFNVNATTVYLPNEPVICTNTSQDALAYWWSFGDGYTTTQEHPRHTYSQLGVYTITLIATNTYTCSDTATIEIDATSDIIFPNVFTPNPDIAPGGVYDVNDYSNQIFFPFASGIEEFKMQIFNRWGELIFETNDIAIGWDGYYRGDLCQQDVYVYKATAIFIDGHKVEKVGDILLLR
ncbi:MAG: hypothetical protein CVU05_00840 [Bacteroidetes bacterium HGW-Bacteroidetes-21]|nr:MAG: hypothetical protein CVU05_00840 [Bacteroidetes bacterium HGW-Bacteroidetes-21]